MMALIAGTPLSVIYLPEPFAVPSATWCTVMALFFGGIWRSDDTLAQDEMEQVRAGYIRACEEDELVPLNHTLYRLYNSDGDLLYVGITSDVVARMAGHRADKWWWDEVADKQFEYLSSRAELEAAEKLAIIRENPLYNITHQRNQPHPTRPAGPGRKS